MEKRSQTDTATHHIYTIYIQYRRTQSEHLNMIAITTKAKAMLIPFGFIIMMMTMLHFFLLTRDL